MSVQDGPVVELLEPVLRSAGPVSVGTAVVVVDELHHLGGLVELRPIDALQLGDRAADVQSSRVEIFSNLAGELLKLLRPSYFICRLYLVLPAPILTAVSLVETFDKSVFLLRFLAGEDITVFLVSLPNLGKKSGKFLPKYFPPQTL